MAARKATDEQLAATWQRHGGNTENIAKALGLSVRQVLQRRLSVERNLGIVLVASRDQTNRSTVKLPRLGNRRLAQLTGVVIVFSDAHFWPDEERSCAFKALITLIKELNPALIVNNGDAFDGSRVSRHPPTGWANLPDVSSELDACKARLGEIEEVSPAGISLIWDLGNHDLRFASSLAQKVEDYRGISGFSLEDHFPAWDFGWSLCINDEVMVKHRYANGIHATYNNTLRSGLTMVTGHLHRLCVTPWSDYNGTRWGVDCGTLSDFGPAVQKFTYSEDNPTNWAQGFAVLTFDTHGRLLPPELCQVIDGVAYFRGQKVL